MPFKSEKQRRWMHANKPEMAKDWEKKLAYSDRKEKMKKEQRVKELIKKMVREELAKLKEGKGVNKVLDMANNNSFGKLGGKTVDAMSANLFKKVYEKVNDKMKEKIDKMNEKQLYNFMVNIWNKFGNQVKI